MIKFVILFHMKMKIVPKIIFRNLNFWLFSFFWNCLWTVIYKDIVLYCLHWSLHPLNNHILTLWVTLCSLEYIFPLPQCIVPVSSNDGHFKVHLELPKSLWCYMCSYSLFISLTVPVLPVFCNPKIRVVLTLSSYRKMYADF